jgi:hypothetical protein
MRRASRLLLLTLTLTSAAASLGTTGAASAQDAPRNITIFQRSVAAPRRAIEAQLGLGYSQGVGRLTDGPNAHVQDVAGVGAGAELNLGYRFSPRFLVGAYGSVGLYSEVLPERNVRSLAAGIQANWHFRPNHSLDPWIGVGVGYRLFSESPLNETSIVRHAFVLPRGSVGVDYRLNPFIAVGPMVAIDLSFFSREQPAAGAAQSDGAAFSSFVFAGVAGRFDLFAEPVHPAADIARR